MATNMQFTNYQTIIPADWLNFINDNVNCEVLINIAALRALTLSDVNSCYVKGYYTQGDGGGGFYILNPTDITTADNGGTVIVSATGGRWYLQLYNNTVYVEQFGAKGDGVTDDTNAINAALANLPARGGTVRMRGRTYAISNTINIGNGNASTGVASTITGIKFIGEGAGAGAFGASCTILQAKDNGSSTPYIQNMVKVNGPIDSVHLEGFKIYCLGANSTPSTGSLARVGLFMTSFTASTVKNIQIVFHTNQGLYILGGSGPTGCYNIYNEFHQVGAISTINGHIGLLMDGNSATFNDTWLSSFYNCRFDTNSALNATAAYFKFVDSCSFHRCHMVGNNTGGVPLAGFVGCYFNAVGNDQFPSGLCFHDCSILTTFVNETAGAHIRVNTFINYGTGDNETIPVHASLKGVTDQGHPFNGWGT